MRMRMVTMECHRLRDSRYKYIDLKGRHGWIGQIRLVVFRYDHGDVRALLFKC